MSFYPHSDDPVFRGRKTSAIDVLWDKKSSQAALQSFTWAKRLGEASGRWQAIIKDSPPYQLDIEDGAILPGDWVDVMVLRNGTVIPLCRGPLDVVHLERPGAGGAPVREWHLAGRDHGAPFESPITYSNAFVRTMTEIVQGPVTSTLRVEPICAPGRLFELLIQAIFGKGTMYATWQLPDALVSRDPSLVLKGAVARFGVLAAGGMPLSADMAVAMSKSGLIDMLEVSKGTTRGGAPNDPYLVCQAGQLVHQTITEWCNPLLNEIIYDLAIDESYKDTGVADGKIRASIRERPFPTISAELAYTEAQPIIDTGFEGPWFNLLTWDVPSWCCPVVSIGRSGMERFNVFMLIADQGFGGVKMEEIAIAPPVWAYEHVKKYGLKAFQEHTKYLASGTSGASESNAAGGWVDERKRWQRMLLEWYCLNPWFMSGTIAAKLPLVDVRVGQRLKLCNTDKEDDAWTFYVEGVDFNYSRSGTSAPQTSTQFTVTRGWKGADKELIRAIAYVTADFRDQM
jgi:hypothetical protein